MREDDTTERGPDTEDDADAPTVDGRRRRVDTPVGPVRAQTLGGERYRLGSELGKGGMGEILVANDDQIGREVVVKRMKERHPSEHAMGRFFREACIQGRLEHPAIVPVHELGVDEDGRPFFTMKRVAGTTLAELIDRAHPRQRLLRAFVDVCLAIEFAHSRGVVHRDIKPQNIVLGDFGEVYVLDWGVAKELDTLDSQGGGDVPEGSTADGTVIGTRGYMAPEQLAADPIDGRADVYALGCVLFEILAGEPLYGKSVTIDTSGMRPSIRAPQRDIPPELDSLCAGSTAHDLAARIQTPRALGEAVQRFLDGDRDLAQRQTLAREHLIAARAAFAAGAGEAERRTAMREAGRALALDPRLAGAGELVSRLMLEPPRDRPPEVQRMIDADNLDTLHRQARAGAYGYLGFLAFLPTVVTGKGTHIGYAFALIALIALNCWLLLPAWTFRNLRARSVRVAVGNALLIVGVARMSSPFLFAPAIATLAATILVFSPTYIRQRQAILLGALFAAAILVPYLAELAGWASATMHLTPDGVELTPPALGLSSGGKHVLLITSIIGMMMAAANIAYANRSAERFVRERLHTQAWQLRQLVS